MINPITLTSSSLSGIEGKSKFPREPGPRDPAPRAPNPLDPDLPDKLQPQAIARYKT